jgi:glycosyltransferase involved in cell wall biosynthesis
MVDEAIAARMPPPRRIVHVIAGLGVGGAETALLRLVRGSGGPYRHIVVSLSPGGALARAFTGAGIQLHELDLRRNPVLAFAQLIALLRRVRPDVVQTWMYHADLLAGVAARMTGCRNVIWGIRTTELTEGDARSTAWIRSICARLSRTVPAAIVCVAEAARRAHIRDGYDPSRMHVIPNGYDTTALAPSIDARAALRAACSIGANDLVVGMVGRFNVSKDPGNFVAAAGLLVAQHPQLRFMMVGRGFDAANAELARWIERTGCPDRFHLLGERADVAACLSAMDAFCLPSRAEAFPNVVGEAMAVELPCVVTDVGDAALLVADTGVVVPREDAVALAAGIHSLLRLSPEARRDLGRAARARIVAGFSLERSRAQFHALYRRLTTASAA